MNGLSEQDIFIGIINVLDISREVPVCQEAHDIECAPILELELLGLSLGLILDTIGRVAAQLLFTSYSGAECLGSDVILNIIVESGEVLRIPCGVCGSDCAAYLHLLDRADYHRCC